MNIDEVWNELENTKVLAKKDKRTYAEVTKDFAEFIKNSGVRVKND